MADWKCEIFKSEGEIGSFRDTMYVEFHFRTKFKVFNIGNVLLSDKQLPGKVSDRKLHFLYVHVASNMLMTCLGRKK